MSPGRRVCCVLCQRSEETKTTGALSTKDLVTAHQNCLLFSSGIYCQNSPVFDDLFGFSVEDVLTEVKRGSRLHCTGCKKKGATVGCEIKQCRRSYHYPCAVQKEAEIIEDTDKGKYGIFCFKHRSQRSENNGSVSGHETSKHPSEAGSSKAYCLTCEKKEGNISLESLSNGIIMMYCHKHAPSSYKRHVNGDSAAAGPPACSSNSNSPSSATHFNPKRRLSFKNGEEWPSKRKAAAKRVSDDSSSDDSRPNTEMEIFAPLESDIDDSANSVPEHRSTPQLIRKDSEDPPECTSGRQPEHMSRDEDEVGTLTDSDADSESLLPVEICTEATTKSVIAPRIVSPEYPKVVVAKTEVDKECSPAQSLVHNPDQHKAGPSAPQQSSAGPPPSVGHSSPNRVTGSPCHERSFISLASTEAICMSPTSPFPSPPGSNFHPRLSTDAPSFWRSCNTAGCTQAIFTDFINEMKDVARRIQSDQASQEDYDLALAVMGASGKLAELVDKQQKALQRKQIELTKAAAAMKDVVSALRR